MEFRTSTRPTKASDLRAVYEGNRDIKRIAINKDCITMSGDGFFYTLQGEGPTLGRPAIFARLHHCNLACTWCDAFYTWDKRSKEFWTESWQMDFDYAADTLDNIWLAATGDSDQIRRVVWTGGEPLMQRHQIDKVNKLLWKCPVGWEVEIETNGTVMPTGDQLDHCQFNVSPKLSNSLNTVTKMVRPKVLKALNEVDSSFKFVCRDEHDLVEIGQLYGKHIDHEKIIIMPEGVVEEEITKHARYLAPYVMEFGWRMMPRFQAIAFNGADRGV